MKEKKVAVIDDLKLIKKHYGENLAKFCRSNLSTILEHSGVLWKVINENFAQTHAIYDDLEQNSEFSNFINIVLKSAKKYLPEEMVYDSLGKTPYELLGKAGYTLYPECKSKVDVLKFKKYYAKGEDLCSFRGDRTKICRVWFAIKDGADKLQREDFIYPQRQDEYGTSVISIQFSKDGYNTLSIKNRYNHTVSNPDSTFSNNLDNIIHGLTNAFEETYGIKQEQVQELEDNISGYVKAESGVYYRKNVDDTLNIAFCEKNVMIDSNGKVTRFDQSRYILFDNYLLDLKEKKLSFIGYGFDGSDEFTDGVTQGVEIQKIEISKEGENRIIHVVCKNQQDCFIKIGRHNELVGYKNDYLTKLSTGFLKYSKNLESLDVPNVEFIGSDVLVYNVNLKELNIPKVMSINSMFLYSNKMLRVLNVPNLVTVGNYVLFYNRTIKEIFAPKLKIVGNEFCSLNHDLQQLNVPNVMSFGKNCFLYCEKISTLNLPELISVGNGFFKFCKSVKEVSAPNLEIMGENCFRLAVNLKNFNAPNIRVVGEDSFKSSRYEFFIRHKAKLNQKKYNKEHSVLEK